jgi:hypothetical protein
MHLILETIQSDAQIAPGRRTTIACARSVFCTRLGNLKALVCAVAVFEAFVWLKDPLHAEEGGAGDYLPGRAWNYPKLGCAPARPAWHVHKALSDLSSSTPPTR